MTAIAAGGLHTCALTSAGAVKCWGRNGWGELGNSTNNGTYDPNPAPADVVGLTGVTAIATGYAHTCALTGAGAIKCWGQNYFGQLGNITNSNHSDLPNPAPLAVTDFGDGTALVFGKATLTTATLNAGTHSITAAYGNGGVGHSDSTSAPLTQEVRTSRRRSPARRAATFTVGTAETFTVTTTGHPVPTIGTSSALPSGVSFADNGDGTATLSGTPTVGGTFPLTITASNGIGTDAEQSFTLTVNKLVSTVSLAAPSPSVYGQPVVLTATVTSRRYRQCAVHARCSFTRHRRHQRHNRNADDRGHRFAGRDLQLHRDLCR